MADLKSATILSSLNVIGSTYLNADVLVRGNLSITGQNNIINTETVTSKDQLIELGAGRTTALTAPAGFYVPKYDGTNSGALVFDSTGTAYVGDVALNVNNEIDLTSSNTTLQPLATRNLGNSDDKKIVIWDNINKTLTAASKIIDTEYLPMNYEVKEGEKITAKTRIVQGDKMFGIYTHKEIYLMPNCYDSSGNTTTSGITLASTGIYPNVDNQISLGSSGTTPYRFKNAYFAGTVTATTFSGKATNVELTKYSGNYNFFLFFGNPTNGKLCYTDTSSVNALTFNPATGTVSASIFAGALSGTATNATSLNNKPESSLNVASATKSTKVAINNAASTSSYNLLLTNVTTNTTEGSVYLSSTNTVKYNVSTGAIETKAYRINNKATMQYNETDDCIEFVFA